MNFLLALAPFIAIALVVTTILGPTVTAGDIVAEWSQWPYWALLLAEIPLMHRFAEGMRANTILLVPKRVLALWLQSLRASGYQGSQRAALAYLRGRMDVLDRISNEVWAKYAQLSPRKEMTDHIVNALRFEVERFLTDQAAA